MAVYMKHQQSTLKYKKFFNCCEAVEESPDPPHGGYNFLITDANLPVIFSCL